MQLQISEFGYLIIFGIYAIAALMLAFLWRALPKGRSRLLVVIFLGVIALAIPWADEVWIAWHFHEMCKEAGVKVYKKVEVEGFYDDTGGGIDIPGSITSEAAIKTFESKGYQYYERRIGYGGEGRPQGVSRVEKVNGEWQVSILDHPTARYQFRYAGARLEEPVGFKIEKSEWVIVDNQSGSVIGREVYYSRYPGWVEWIWLQFFGSGRTTCQGVAPTAPELRHSLYDYVLIPAKR